MYAFEDIGRAIPVVPNIDIPSIIPSRLFIVLGAISFPSGIIIFTIAPLFSGRYFLTFAFIIFLGTGFIAYSPTGIWSPDLVTFPTPSPAVISTLPASSVKVTSDLIRIPRVTSGSLYVGFLTVDIALFLLNNLLSSISTVSSSFGAVISITSGALSVMVSIAATLAAVATLPVVIPDFSSEFL